MEAQVIRLCGTPEEVAQAIKLLPALQDAEALERQRADSTPDFVESWMDEWAVPEKWRPAYRQLIEETLSWDGVQLRITKGREDTSDQAGRIRFVYRGVRKGFAFLHHRGRLFLNLGPDADIDDFPNAVRRRGKSANRPFSTTIYVRSTDAVQEAVGLLGLAYERAKTAGEPKK